MTNEGDIPWELAELEGRLKAAGPEPPASLRERVVSCAAAELSLRARRRRWDYLSAAAAGVLVALNLLLCSTMPSESPGTAMSESSDQRAAMLYRQIRQAAPELSAQEASVQSVRLSAAGRLQLYARPQSGLPR